MRVDNLLLLAAEMREMDRVAIEEMGVPGPVLMENAGRGAADVAAAMLGDPLVGRRVDVVCGAGNNGGDGYVLARHLAIRGAATRVLQLVPRHRIRGDAAVHLAIVESMDVPVLDFSGDGDLSRLGRELSDADLVVDALLGTGLDSDVRAPFDAAIAAINAATSGAAGPPVLALDIPSGISADSGEVCGAAVRASTTATFAFPKRGLYLHPGRAHAGQIHVVDIGMPLEVPRRLGGRARLLDVREAARAFPPRRADSHKGTFGHLLVWAGSDGMAGAAVLSARGALRAGVGLCTVATTLTVQRAVQGQCSEAMCRVIADDTAPGDARVPQRAALDELMRDRSAVVVGPGLGTSPGLQALIRDVVASAPLPMLIDADGLNAIAAAGADALAALRSAPASRLLTPHPGEAARLLGITSAEVQRDRFAAAARLSQASGAHVVLKGASTIVAHPDGSLWLCPAGNPGMATGGSGDVLSGVGGALLAAGVDPGLTARAAVWVHARGGDRLVTQLGEAGITAGDLPWGIAEAIAEAQESGDSSRSGGAQWGS